MLNNSNTQNTQQKQANKHKSLHDIQKRQNKTPQSNTRTTNIRTQNAKKKQHTQTNKHNTP